MEFFNCSKKVTSQVWHIFLNIYKILLTQWRFSAPDTRPWRYIEYSRFPPRPLNASAESPIRELQIKRTSIY